MNNFSEMRIIRNPSFVSEILDGEVCVFDPLNAFYFNLNSSGSFIWNFLKTSKSIDEIYEVLLEEYNLKLEDKKEVLCFIDECIKNKIFIKKIKT